MTSARGNEDDMIAWLDAEKALHQPLHDQRSGERYCATCRVPYPCEFAG